MKLLDKIPSKVDKTIKFIFRLSDGLIMEMSYINKDDGKDIICVPTQTSCNMGCTFCHITKHSKNLKHRNLTWHEMYEGASTIYRDLKLHDTPKPLLISYMGLGEPLCNWEDVILSMMTMRDFLKSFCDIRFAIATSMPKLSYIAFSEMACEIYKRALNVKIHLSLHYTIDSDRILNMPKSDTIENSIQNLCLYSDLTNNKTEIHYTLIDGVNDTPEDAYRLTKLLENKDINVKFLFYNTNDENKASNIEKLENFKSCFDKAKIHYEYYIPPGIDIGSSCGMFTMEYYLKYNKINKYF